MNKEKNNIIILTREAQKALKTKEHTTYNNNLNKIINILINKKKTTQIIIYDITKNKKPNQIFIVNNHINKTGKDPLRGLQKQLKIDFVDVSQIYKQHTKGITTTCFGDRNIKNKKAQYPSTNLCIISVLCKALGYKTIKGVLINLNSNVLSNNINLKQN